MKQEQPTSESLHEIALNIRGAELDLHLLNEKGPDTIAIEVHNVSDMGQIAEAATAALTRRFWFMDPSWENEELKERFCIHLGAHITEVFVFGKGLDEKIQTEISKTLERMYNALGDKALWTLESVQILPHTKINPKNGELFRGMEFPAQRRFELYPEALKPSMYRGGELHCSELEGTISHETTHVTLEEVLRPHWETNDLGWKTDESVIIEQPGGARTNIYNERPQECPTSYGALNQDDDRADSVVAFLFDPTKLHQTRREILERVFTGTESPVEATIEPMNPTMPKLPAALNVTVSERRKNLFGLTTVRPGNKQEIISLSDLRKTRGIPEPKF